MAMALFSMPMQVRDARTGDVADKIRGSPLRRQRDEPNKQAAINANSQENPREERRPKKNTPFSRLFMGIGVARQLSGKGREGKGPRSR